MGKNILNCKKITKRRALNFLIAALLFFIVIVLSSGSNTVKLWMSFSVLASVIAPTLVTYNVLRKESLNQKLKKGYFDEIKLSHWGEYGWKYLFIDSELILISIILEFDTIGDVSNTIHSILTSTNERSTDGINILGTTILTLIFFLASEFCIITVMTLFYGINTKDIFLKLHNHPIEGSTDSIKSIGEIYDDQLMIVFTLFFANLLYLASIQHYLVTF